MRLENLKVYKLTNVDESTVTDFLLTYLHVFINVPFGH